MKYWAKLTACATPYEQLHRPTRPSRRLEPGDRSLLRFEHGLIHLTRCPVGTPHVHGARPVRTITCEYNTEVADHEPAARDAGLGGATMDYRRPLACRDDRRKRHALGPGAPSFDTPWRRPLRLLSRPDESSAARSETGWHPIQSPRRMRRISSASFTMRARSTRGGAETSFHLPLQDRPQMIAHGKRDGLGLEPNSTDWLEPREATRNSAAASSRRFAGNDNASAGDLGTSLCRRSGRP